MAWFATWFDSPYYPLLYQHRDEQEARAFMRAFLQHLQLPSGAKLLDLACGRGRHARFLAEQGYQLTGLDLSPASIADAQAQTEGDNPQFAVHDMRQPLPGGPYQAILNLFTSFGYFETDEEQAQVLSNIRQALAPEGYLLIDFFNARKVIAELVLEEQKTLADGIEVELRRYVLNGYITKDIYIQDGPERQVFQERVRAFDLEDWTALLQKAGFRIERLFGDYALGPFQPLDSPRLILLARPC